MTIFRRPGGSAVVASSAVQRGSTTSTSRRPVSDGPVDVATTVSEPANTPAGVKPRTTLSAYFAHLKRIGWFLRDSWVISRRATLVAVSAELTYFGIQALAFALLVSALANPGALLSSWGTYVAAAVLTVGLGILLFVAEGLKYVAQSAKYRLAYDYEVSALERVLRYGHRANRFDKQTIKDLVSRSPQVSARVAMASVDGLVPAIVGTLAAVVMIVISPWFAAWLTVALVITGPIHLLVLRRGRSATQNFYSPAGLIYARDAVLFFSRARLGVSDGGIFGITDSAKPSLKELETRRATPNRTYLVTGGAMSLTLAGLVGYSVIVAKSSENASAQLLQIFFILRFLYAGVGGVTGAFSKCHILLPRVEPVMWALKGQAPPMPNERVGTGSTPELDEEDFDDR